jgi:hypothetical protein
MRVELIEKKDPSPDGGNGSKIGCETDVILIFPSPVQFHRFLNGL